MKIGIGDNPYRKRYGMEKGYETICSLGYDCVDYQQFVDTEKVLFQYDWKTFEKHLSAERALIESLGLEISQTHGPWRYPPRDSTPEERAERFEKMSVSIRGTALLGAECFVIHPIMPWGMTGGPDPEEYIRMNRDFLYRLSEEGRKNGVVVCLENMPMPELPLGTPEACLALTAEIGSPFLKFCLDTGHCSVLGGNPADAVRAAGKEMLQVLHVHDNDGCQDRHWVPFTGVIDWNDFGNALQEIGFEGSVSIETSPPEAFCGEILELQERSLCLSALQIAGRKK